MPDRIDTSTDLLTSLRFLHKRLSKGCAWATKPPLSLAWFYRRPAGRLYSMFLSFTRVEMSEITSSVFEPSLPSLLSSTSHHLVTQLPLFDTTLCFFFPTPPSILHHLSLDYQLDHNKSSRTTFKHQASSNSTRYVKQMSAFPHSPSSLHHTIPLVVTVLDSPSAVSAKQKALGLCNMKFLIISAVIGIIATGMPSANGAAIPEEAVADIGPSSLLQPLHSIRA